MEKKTWVGRWKKEEHELFLEGLSKYGKEWKKIATLIGSRTIIQVRTHAQKFFQKAKQNSVVANELHTYLNGRKVHSDSISTSNSCSYSQDDNMSLHSSEIMRSNSLSLSHEEHNHDYCNNANNNNNNNNMNMNMNNPAYPINKNSDIDRHTSSTLDTLTGTDTFYSNSINIQQNQPAFSLPSFSTNDTYFSDSLSFSREEANTMFSLFPCFREDVSSGYNFDSDSTLSNSLHDYLNNDIQDLYQSHPVYLDTSASTTPSTTNNNNDMNNNIKNNNNNMNNNINNMSISSPLLVPMDISSQITPSSQSNSMKDTVSVQDTPFDMYTMFNDNSSLSNDIFNVDTRGNMTYQSYTPTYLPSTTFF
ncbi:hypothetical protein WA158_004724 [Blastocystis sp. Blastoise]